MQAIRRRYGGVVNRALEAIMAPTLLDEAQIAERLAALHPDWSGNTEKLNRSIEFADFPTAVEFVNRLAPRCEEINHHPDLAIRWRWVDVALSTHSAGGVTDLDTQLAGIVDEVAAELPLASG
jgi:4a-hydroxytetrahydrobiopterin dehydratase